MSPFRYLCPLSATYVPFPLPLSATQVADAGFETPALTARGENGDILNIDRGKTGTSRQEARKRRIAINVKPFAGTLRVTNPVR
jgi:hypothetical protein